MHHLIKCDQGPHLFSSEGLKLSQVHSSRLCQLVTLRDQAGPLSTLLAHNLTPRPRAYWRRQVTEGRASFLFIHSLSNPPLQKITFYEFAQCPFHLLEADEKPGCCLDELPFHQCVTARCPDCAYLLKMAQHIQLLLQLPLAILLNQIGGCCTAPPPQRLHSYSFSSTALSPFAFWVQVLTERI